MGFIEEREIAERALALEGLDEDGDPVFPRVAQRFLRAREATGLTLDEVAAQWGEQPSMYWDLEFHDSEAFDVVSVQDLVTIAAILKVSVMQLLFSQEPPQPLATTSYPEVTRKLRVKMAAEGTSVDQLSEQVGWDLKECLEYQDKLAELPIFDLRLVCKAVDLDWATTLANPTARPRPA